MGEQEASQMMVFGFESSGWSMTGKTFLRSNVTLEICKMVLIFMTALFDSDDA